MKQLDELLKILREADDADQLVNRDELINIVERRSATNTLAPRVLSNTVSKLTKGKLMTIIGGILAVGVVGWLVINTTSEVAQMIQTQTPESLSTNLSLPVRRADSKYEPLQALHAKTAQTSDLTDPFAMDRIPILELRDAELRSLGIIATDSSVAYKLEREMKPLMKSKELIDQLKNLNYDVSNPDAIVRWSHVLFADTSVQTIDPCKNPNGATSDPLCPADGYVYHLTDKNVWRYRRCSSLRLEWHAYTRFKDEQLDQNTLFKTFSDTAVFNAKSFPKDSAYSYFSKLVPVRKTIWGRNGKYLLVMWFVPTPEFVAALPAQQQMIVKRHFIIFDRVEMPQEQQNELDALSEQRKKLSNQKLDSKEIMKLTASELQNLGVVVSGDSIIFPMEEMVARTLELPARFTNDTYKAMLRSNHMTRLEKLRVKNYDMTHDQILCRSKGVLTFDGFTRTHSESYTGWNYEVPNPLSPIGYQSTMWKYTRSNTDGPLAWHIYMGEGGTESNSPLLKSRTNGNDKNEKESAGKKVIDLDVFNSMLAFLNTKAVPVQIELNNSASLVEEAGRSNLKVDSSMMRRMPVALWFIPTPEFISRLPERYQTSLRKELALYERVIKGEIAAEQACSELEKEKATSFLDLCKYSSGTLRSLSVSPNPARDFIRCTFVVTEQSKVSISLFSNDGRFVKPVLTEYGATPGTNKVDQKLPQLESGIYLLVMTNDRGEQVVQQIVIQ